MAFQIRVSLGALREASNQMRAVANDSEEFQGVASDLGAKLGNAWDGVASDQSIEALESFRAAFQNGSQGLRDGADMLEAIANQFEAIDNGETIPIAYRLDILDYILPFGRGGLVFDLKLTTENIRIVPDEVREVAHRCDVLCKEVESISNRVETISRNLESSWEGKAHNRFLEKVTRVERFYIDLSQEIMELSSKIRFAADRYEEIDNMLSQE